MTECYEMCMSARPRGAIRLIYRFGEFESLPREAKRGGPWTGSQVGLIARLKPEIRLAIAREGYFRVEGVPMDFSPEVAGSSL
jgi:hypothetical protein